MKKHTLIIDVEAIGLDKPYIYDIGIILAELKDGFYQEIGRNHFIIKQIYDNKALFNTAYYSDKKPLYTSLLKGKKSVKKFYGHALNYIERLIKKFKIDRVYAYNADYDSRAFKYTSEFFKSKDIFKNVEWYDIMAIANNFIHNTDKYKEFCKKNDFITFKGYYKTSAETTYQFILNDKSFKEEHIGVMDCEIEMQILNECIKKGYDFRHYKKKFLRV